MAFSGSQKVRVELEGYQKEHVERYFSLNSKLWRVGTPGTIHSPVKRGRVCAMQPGVEVAGTQEVEYVVGALWGTLRSALVGSSEVELRSVAGRHAHPAFMG